MRRLSCWFTLLLVLSAAVLSPLHAQTPHMQISVERQSKGGAVVTGPQHVFQSGDLVRFRFNSSFNGYLYVTDWSTSGKYLELFPPKGGQDANAVQRGKEYLIPASRGAWFRVDNPPGYETVYFLISPTRLEKSAGAPQREPEQLSPPPSPAAPETLLPRCDDAIFRARGECVDVMAGPRALDKDAALPAELHAAPPTSSRDITVINKPDSSVIAPADGVDGPLIYEFRLAHR